MQKHEAPKSYTTLYDAEMRATPELTEEQAKKAKILKAKTDELHAEMPANHHPQEQIDKHLSRLNAYREDYQANSTGESSLLPEATEFLLSSAIASGQFDIGSPKVEAALTFDYDDVIDGVDIAVQAKEGVRDKSHPFGIDITSAFNDDMIAHKLSVNYDVKTNQSGEVTSDLPGTCTLLYYPLANPALNGSDPNHPRTKVTNMPRFVVGIDSFTTQQCLDNIEIDEETGIVKTKENSIFTPQQQFRILYQMQQQAQFCLQYNHDNPEESTRYGKNALQDIRTLNAQFRDRLKELYEASGTELSLEEYAKSLDEGDRPYAKIRSYMERLLQASNSERKDFHLIYKNKTTIREIREHRRMEAEEEFQARAQESREQAEEQRREKLHKKLGKHAKQAYGLLRPAELQQIGDDDSFMHDHINEAAQQRYRRQQDDQFEDEASQKGNQERQDRLEQKRRVAKKFGRALRKAQAEYDRQSDPSSTDFNDN